MSNDFYNHNDGVPATLTRGASTTIRSEFDLVQIGFDKMPTLAQMWGESQNYGIAGGSVDAWTATVAASAITGYADGLQVRLKFTAANTSTTPTLNLNGLGAKTIVSEAGVAIQPGDIKAGAIVSLLYSQATDRFQITLGNFSSSAALSAATALTQAGIAATQAGIATTQAGIATTQAGIATTQAGTAAASSTQAGIYAAAAATGAKFFNTIALGNAGVADAATFGVIAGGADALTRPSIYRRESAGVSTLLYSVLPASEYDTTFPTIDETATGGVKWGIVDPTGNLAVALLADGTFQVTTLSATSLKGSFVGDGSGGSIGGNSDSELQLSGIVKDASGNVAEGWGADGSKYLRKLVVTDLQFLNPPTGKNGAPNPGQSFAAQYAGDFGLYEVNGVRSYGQSLALGVGDGLGAGFGKAISKTQEYNDLMFVGGMLTAGTNGEYTLGQRNTIRASLAAAVEGTGEDRETGVVGAMSAVHWLLQKENGVTTATAKYSMHGSAPGVGGKSLSLLSKGGTYYPILLEDVTAAKSLCDAANKTFAERALFMTQGEAGPYDATWSTLMSQLITDYNTDAKAVTGQTEDIPVISYQLATEFNFPQQPLVAWQQEALARSDNRFIVACPMYHFDYMDSPGIHLVATSYTWQKLYYGIAYKRRVIDGNPFLPLAPSSTKRVGNVVMVKFNVPVKPLVLDTDRVAAATNYGFELFQADGTTPITISTVELAGPDLVKITAGAAVPAGAILRYASQAATPTNTIRRTGARGNLRDSQGDNIRIQTQGLTFRMDNWCLIFKRSL